MFRTNIAPDKAYFEYFEIMRIHLLYQLFFFGIRKVCKRKLRTLCHGFDNDYLYCDGTIYPNNYVGIITIDMPLEACCRTFFSRFSLHGAIYGIYSDYTRFLCRSLAFCHFTLFYTNRIYIYIYIIVAYHNLSILSYINISNIIIIAVIVTLFIPFVIMFISK